MVARCEMDRDRRKRQKWARPVPDIRRWRNGRTYHFRAGTEPRMLTRRQLIIYVGRQVALWTPLRAVRPNGERVELPPIQLRGENGQRFRFMPDGKALVY